MGFEDEAHAWLARDPAGAFDVLAPLVRAREARAADVMEAVARAADDLTRAEELRSDTSERVARLDVRWAALCDELREAKATAPLGCGVRDVEWWEIGEAIRWTHRPTPWIPTMALPEGDPFCFPYPLLVVGLAKTWNSDPRAEGERHVEPGLARVEHQYAGMGTCLAEWTGFLLRPPASVAEAIVNLAWSIRNTGFVVSEPELEELTRATTAALPGVAWRMGEEALLVADGWGLTSLFDGLEVLAFEPRVERWRYRLTWDEAVFRTEVVGRLGPEHVATLTALARGRCATKDWHVALVWANSD